ncbi:hypothetical protein VTN00DRAFT_4152 [Thermoascus crustaceus]|uniref:uncharacterized protein n=1 Tax=Thermoascus crustaceus TaxID=5088 RepID=UPI00374449F8
MLADQTSFAGSAFPTADAVSTGPSPFDTGAAFPGDFLGLSLQDEDNVWGLSPMSPTMQSWNSKGEQLFTNPSLERDLKNSHVRNGQPTPPPYDDKKPCAPDDLFALGKSPWDDYAPESVDSRQRRSTSDHSADSGSSKRRKIRENKQSSATSHGGAETDDQKQEKVKREKFLERNRLAASKCRQKKKEHTMMLESRYKEQSDKKEELVAEIARLRSEILGLKNEVLKHAQCGDEPIKLHLAQMVKKITYNDTADFGDAADATDATDETTSPSVQGAMSFGFDDPLQLEPQQTAESIEQQIRRDSEASISFSADDNFDDLINV